MKRTANKQSSLPKQDGRCSWFVSPGDAIVHWHGPAACTAPVGAESQEWSGGQAYKARTSPRFDHVLLAGHPRAAARHAGQAVGRAPDPPSLPTPTLAREARAFQRRSSQLPGAASSDQHNLLIN
jgi:hypothetical protein